MDWTRRKFISTGFMTTLGGVWLSSGFDNLSFQSGPNKLPGGFWPVMMTPFNEDLSIDYPGLKRLIRWYEDAGSTGLFANCGSSEMYDLSNQERIDLTKFVVENTNLPVVSTGTFSGQITENADFIKKIHDTGVQAVVLIPSVMVKKEETDAELLHSFEGILNQTGNIPLGIYECPSPYSRKVSPEILNQLQKTGRFLYFKDTTCDAELVAHKIAITSNSSLGIYNAHSPDVLHSIQHGGAGMSCIAGNYYPELFSFLWENGRDKEVSKSVKKVNDFILKNKSVIGKKYSIGAKYFMNLRGLELTLNSRKKTQPLDSSDKARLDLLWKELSVLGDEALINLVTYS
ncbi:dihydrodipicolinate synthase family protein [uncultured Kriegella sp.]|mgnify:CR=1 FL=1|uniref:dihydrodipicolinate synthase family protein n=1 Tax=uncultured Kriegella sp. TaxID=1798910 RepID=UPI0030DBE434|tara:strand:- start:20954 stop:21988 length:1035 start_codon:yes stop_codon:yes gene_type:complete